MYEQFWLMMLEEVEYKNKQQTPNLFLNQMNFGKVIENFYIHPNTEKRSNFTSRVDIIIVEHVAQSRCMPIYLFSGLQKDKLEYYSHLQVLTFWAFGTCDWSSKKP